MITAAASVTFILDQRGLTPRACLSRLKRFRANDFVKISKRFSMLACSGRLLLHSLTSELLEPTLKVRLDGSSELLS